MSAHIIAMPGVDPAAAIDHARVIDAMQLLATCTAEVAALAAGRHPPPVDAMDRIMRFTALVDMLNRR